MFSMVAVKLVIGLIGLLVVVRLIGKKSLSEITPTYCWNLSMINMSLI